MFDSSNWIYLAAGCCFGFGIRALVERKSKPKLDKSAVTELQRKLKDVENQLVQVNLAYQMSQELGAFKAGFLARTTHALRSPLNGLIGLHQLILSDLCENPEEEREFTEQSLERALRLLKLIDEILNVSRLQAGTNRLNIQPFLLRDIFKETYNLTAILAENRSYKYNVVQPQEDIYALADPYWLRYTLVSLVETAIAGMEEGGINLQVEEENLGMENRVQIYLDVPHHAIPTAEAVDLSAAETPTELRQQSPGQSIVSPGMRIILCQGILEVMGGKLEISSHPFQDEVTRLVLSLPVGNQSWQETSEVVA